jgi:hypothetical protein
MDDKDLQEKVLELQDEVCIRFIKYDFIQLYYRRHFLFNHKVFLSFVCKFSFFF